MKRIILSAAVLVSLIATQEAQAQQGFGTNLPDKSSVIELQSTKKGLLIPRIDIDNLATPAPVTNPAVSLLVYNINKATGEGFYYWDGTKWVKFTTSVSDLTAKVAGKDNKVTVTEATADNVTTYTVGVDETNLNINNLGGGKLNTNKIAQGTEGQVLVTKTVGSDLVPTWVDAAEVASAITAGNGLTKNASTSAIELGGALTKATEINTSGANTLAIKGLQNALKTGGEDVVVMGADGILKKIAKKDLVEAAIATGNLEAKTLTGAGITVTAGSTAGSGSQVNNALLADVTLGIADNAITSDKILDGTIESKDIKSVGNNKVLVTNSSGTVTWVDKSTFAPNTGSLTGESGVLTVANGSNSTLRDVEIKIASGGVSSSKIAPGAVTEGKIANGAVTTEKIKGETANNGKVMTTNNGQVQWVAPETLMEKVVVNGNGNATVSSSLSGNTRTYTVAVATANTTNLGLVKQADNNAEVLINNGVLSLNKSNIAVGGDLTGNVGSATVTGLQGHAIANQTPGNNQVLTYDNVTKEWTPKNLPAAQNVNEAINVKNGLSKDSAPDKAVVLGGALDRATTITTDDSNTLAIAGLQKVNTLNKIVVAEADGKLRTLEKSLVYEIDANQVVTALTGYSDFVPQIDIYAEISNANIDITLPTPSEANKGQIITVKVANTTELTAEYYVNIDSVGGKIISGQLPYQSWTIKSNGTIWSLVK